MSESRPDAIRCVWFESYGKRLFSRSNLRLNVSTTYFAIWES